MTSLKITPKAYGSAGLQRATFSINVQRTQKLLTDKYSQSHNSRIVLDELPVGLYIGMPISGMRVATVQATKENVVVELLDDKAYLKKFTGLPIKPRQSPVVFVPVQAVDHHKHGYVKVENPRSFINQFMPEDMYTSCELDTLDDLSIVYRPTTGMTRLYGYDYDAEAEVSLSSDYCNVLGIPQLIAEGKACMEFPHYEFMVEHYDDPYCAEVYRQPSNDDSSSNPHDHYELHQPKILPVSSHQVVTVMSVLLTSHALGIVPSNELLQKLPNVKQWFNEVLGGTITISHEMRYSDMDMHVRHLTAELPYGLAVKQCVDELSL